MHHPWGIQEVKSPRSVELQLRRQALVIHATPARGETKRGRCSSQRLEALKGKEERNHTDENSPSYTGPQVWRAGAIST
jgi:hypothetical protein